MIYIVTNHHGPSVNKFVHLQSKYLQRYSESDYKVFCGISNFEYDSKQDAWNINADPQYMGNYELINTDDPRLENQHHTKMNFLSHIIKDNHQINDEDLLVFLDGDAFPVSHWDNIVSETLEEHKVVCVYRTENLEPLVPNEQKPYPHLMFVAVKAKFWFENELNWEKSPHGGPIGPPLKFWLEEKGYSTYPLLRSNKVDVHPLFFGVYGDLIYHHGSSSGNANVYDSFDIWSRKGLNKDDSIDIRYADMDMRYPHIPFFNGELSNLVYQAILNDDDFIRNYFMGVK
jgi:hypothetical protein